MRIASITTALILSLFAAALSAQEKLPVIKSNTSVISIQDGKELRKSSWTLADLYP